ncbi:MAG: hypothetical protein CL609_15515 [Anaerolineaceae bacterium]|nr:hypothetical protein [Anaerolineaceae bacterium]
MCGGRNININKILLPLLAEAGGFRTQVQEPVSHNLMTCPNCNSRIEKSYTWCPVCGSPLKPTPCAYCGQQLSITDKHCKYCGAPRQVHKNW